MLLKYLEKENFQLRADKEYYFIIKSYRLRLEAIQLYQNKDIVEKMNRLVWEYKAEYFPIEEYLAKEKTCSIWVKNVLVAHCNRLEANLKRILEYFLQILSHRELIVRPTSKQMEGQKDFSIQVPQLELV